MAGELNESSITKVGPGHRPCRREVTGSIDKGYVLLVGITHSDTEEDMEYIAKKIAGLRLWEDEEGKMNRSIRRSGWGYFIGFPIHLVCGYEKRETSEFH